MPIHLSHSPLKLMRANTDAEEAQYRVARDRERSMERGISDLGNAFAQIAAVGARYQEQERINYVNKSKLFGHQQMLEASDAWEQGLTGENAMESVGGLKTKLGEIGSKILESAPDDQSRDVANVQLSMLASGIVREAGRKAHKVHVDYSTSLVDQALNDTRKSAYHSGLGGGGPADLTAYLDAVDTTMDAQAKAGYWLDPVTADKLKRRTKSDIAKGFVKGGLDSDTDGVVLRTIGDLQAGRYNALDFDDLLTLGHAASSAKERIKAKHEADARRAAADAEDSMVSRVYARALSITGQGDRQDPGAAAALLYAPTAKDLFKGVPDKVLAKAAHWARSSWEVQKGREAEQQKDMEDAATDTFENMRLKGQLSHDTIEANPAVPSKVRKQWHDILDADADRLATKTDKAQGEQSKSIAASLLSKVASGEITRVSEVSPFRAQGLQDDEYNTVVKSLESAKESRNKPWMAMADDYLKTVTKSKSNESGILEPGDVVRVHSILQDELTSGKLEAKDILRRTQELTDLVFHTDYWLGPRDVRRFEVEPGGQLPVTETDRKKRDEALGIVARGGRGESMRDLTEELFQRSRARLLNKAEPAQTPTDAAAAPQQGGQGAQYKTAQEVKEAYKAGKITKEEASEIIKANGLAY